MRRTIELNVDPVIDFTALRPYRRFLFRNVGDEQRWVLGVDELRSVERPDKGVGDWVFGFLSYEMKNSLEELHSRSKDELGYPTSYWFVPRFVFELNDERCVLHVHEADEYAGMELARMLFRNDSEEPGRPIKKWVSRTPRSEYIRAVNTLLEHIHRGDIYEVNYCTSRHAEVDADWDPFIAYVHLFTSTKAEHAGFLRMSDRFALCVSPERYLAFDGVRIMAQPMKGTRARSGSAVEDERIAIELANDPKERAENIMALDVMRNDLSRVAKSRSVVVDELCAVRPHARVLQMTSTVRAELREGVTPYEAILASFPMASMTGAPKHRAMQLIDDMEDQCRGLFSGTMGFFSPDGTADFNVVIRTLFFDAAEHKATVVTGGALTANCDPEKEWDECELKARSVIDALQ
ncbi:MAG: anthranilate synthase component I family protein [Flavobacteriales bacterium]|nr:anthranilate synthase component I family protein [Flavobacteriales bacterium]